MKYKEFERIVSQKRMNRYVQACGGNTRKAMILYRYNIELSQVLRLTSSNQYKTIPTSLTFVRG